MSEELALNKCDRPTVLEGELIKGAGDQQQSGQI